MMNIVIPYGDVAPGEKTEVLKRAIEDLIEIRNLRGLCGYIQDEDGKIITGTL